MYTLLKYTNFVIRYILFLFKVLYFKKNIKTKLIYNI